MPGAPSGQKKKVQICFQALAALKDHDIVYFSFAPWRASVSFYCMPRHGNVPLKIGLPLKEARWKLFGGFGWTVNLSGVRRVVEAILMHMASSTPITV